MLGSSYCYCILISSYHLYSSAFCPSFFRPWFSYICFIMCPIITFHVLMALFCFTDSRTGRIAASVEGLMYTGSWSYLSFLQIGEARSLTAGRSRRRLGRYMVNSLVLGERKVDNIGTKKIKVYRRVLM